MGKRGGGKQRRARDAAWDSSDSSEAEEGGTAAKMHDVADPFVVGKPEFTAELFRKHGICMDALQGIIKWFTPVPGVPKPESVRMSRVALALAACAGARR
jgi:hypothetical protein